ncbi:hypothetical protein GCM10019059_24130 [Camelimonas fluminis]|uniref:Transcriptional regulator n=1 Tax=Camelimonas fluminis TaxID=1576911 RepID=A0ABV7UAZ7_9HYPH|nr:hypothetical protein [Camelimonas fluminis]GHE63802.1 hypothetical protein GCM10019059_24130 [Camelimonas fluminis]
MQYNNAFNSAFYWRVMETLQKEYGYFSVAVLSAVFPGKGQAAIRTYLVNLHDMGAIELVGTQQANTAAYRIVNHGEAPPLVGRLAGGRQQQALWTAIRSLGTFSALELAVSASTDDQEITQRAAAAFARDLVKIGYLAEVATTRSPANRTKPVYRLLPRRNTGPRAPIILRQEQASFDVNLMRKISKGDAT